MTFSKAHGLDGRVLALAEATVLATRSWEPLAAACACDHRSRRMPIEIPRKDAQRLIEAGAQVLTPAQRAGQKLDCGRAVVVYYYDFT